MAKDEASAPTNFEAPAPVCVCGLLVVAALTKGGHPHWGIGGMISAYVFYLALQYPKHGAGSARALAVTDTIIMNIRTFTVGLATAATIAAATVLMSGAVVAGSHRHQETLLKCLENSGLIALLKSPLQDRRKSWRDAYPFRFLGSLRSLLAGVERDLCRTCDSCYLCCPMIKGSPLFLFEVIQIVMF